MNYFLTLAAAVALATSLTACSKSKEEAVIPPCDCPELPTPPIGIGPRLTGPSLGYALPCFNPRNPREIVYYKADANFLTEHGLYVANLDTKQQRRIHAGSDYVLDVAWGPTGWLALSKGDQVWKLKANGDSLTQLTFGRPHYLPQWSPDGQRLVCREPDSPGAPLIIIDKNGRKLATLTGFPTQQCHGWSPDGTKLVVEYGPYGQGYGVGVYEIASNRVDLVQVTDTNPNNSFGMLNGAAWLADSRNVIWSNGTGIYATDTRTHQTKKLHTGCTTRVYLNPDVSADGRTILVRRVDNRDVDNGQGIYTESNLWLMDINGSNERKLVF